MAMFTKKKLGEFNTDELLSRLLRSYSVYYDVTPEEKTGREPLVATCEFRLRQEKSPFPMSNRMLYSYDSFEYAYVFKTDVLDMETLDRCVDMACEEGLSRINPSKEHRCTFVTAIFLCDSASPEVRKALRRKSMHKDFNFSLHGWMDLQTALVESDGMKITTNSAGRVNAKNLRSIYSI